MLPPFWVNFYMDPAGKVVNKTPITNRFCFVNRELAAIYSDVRKHIFHERPLAYRIKVKPKAGVSNVGVMVYTRTPPQAWLDRPWR